MRAPHRSQRLSALLFIVAQLCMPSSEWNVAAQTSLCGLVSGDHGQLLAERTAVLRSAIPAATCCSGRESQCGFCPRTTYATLGTAKFADARFGGRLSLCCCRYLLRRLFHVAALRRRAEAKRERRSPQLPEAFFGLRSSQLSRRVRGIGQRPGARAVTRALERRSRASTLYVGLQVDGLWLALPFILGYEWLRGTPDPGD